VSEEDTRKYIASLLALCMENLSAAGYSVRDTNMIYADVLRAHDKIKASTDD